MVWFEVTHAGVADGPGVVELVERPQRRLRVVEVGRPVDVQQVEVVGPEPVETPPDALDDVLAFRPRLHLVDCLRGEKNVLARDVGASDPLADVRLVPVHFRGVDVSVAGLDCLGHVLHPLLPVLV